jgi:hypothetical protein
MPSMHRRCVLVPCALGQSIAALNAYYNMGIFNPELLPPHLLDGREVQYTCTSVKGYSVFYIDE